MRLTKTLFTLLLILGSTVMLLAQVTLVGTVTDSETNAAIPDAAVSINGTALYAATNANGRFELAKVPKGKNTIVVTHVGYKPLETTLDIQPSVKGQTEVRLVLKKDNAAIEIGSTPVTSASGEIPTVTLEEADSETEGSSEMPNLLHASRDAFQSFSNFGWSFARFRERGLDGENFPLYLNGVSINDPESGNAFFGEFGGLNDVLRARESSLGMEAAEFAFTELAGATNLDTRASSQRKQIRVSHSFANRTYTNRSMITMSSGLMPRGWAVTASFSRRWAQSGWYEGTPFDGYSYFLSVDKKLQKHTFNITVLGAPTKRGANADTFEEMYELAGTRRYNPNWGFWNGEKRNSNIMHGHQPIAIFRWDFNPSKKLGFTLSTYGQAGQRGRTRLDWFNAQNPNPDFARNLPSAQPNQTQTDLWRRLMADNQSLRQINWEGIYAGNLNNQAMVLNANGVSDNTVRGAQSSVLIGDFREDSRELGSNLLATYQLSNRSKLTGGLNYQYYVGKNFKTVDDLLGGDFVLDVNTFAQQDVVGNPSALNNDVRTPNRIAREGDTYGWDYDENIRKSNAWAQVVTNLHKWSFTLGAQASQVQFWRVGHMQNGRFPDNSLGKSEVMNFFTYGVKGGATYKLNGRNYLSTNLFNGTRAPLFRDIAISPRTRDDFYDNAKPYGILGAEVSYIHRSPRFRSRLTGYWTRFDDQIESAVIFGQAISSFGTQLMTGVDQVNSGIEYGFEIKPFESFTQFGIAGGTNLGYYRYTSRPTLYFFNDNTNQTILDGVRIYQNNFLVPRTPQTTASLQLRYEGKKFWFANLTGNFVDDLWYDFDRMRRTEDFALILGGLGITPNSPTWNQAINQTKAPAAFTLDFFGGKSWRIKSKYFLYLNLGVNNILNNQNIISGGREVFFRAFRDFDDPRLYQTEQLYATGTTYFLGLTLRI